MEEENRLSEMLKALLQTSASLLLGEKLLAPFLEYVERHPLKELRELRVDQYLVTEALPLSPEEDDSWVGWIQLDRVLQSQDHQGEKHVVHLEQTIPFRIPPR